MFALGICISSEFHGNMDFVRAIFIQEKRLFTRNIYLTFSIIENSSKNIIKYAVH
jgi:hypothetical protein